MRDVLQKLQCKGLNVFIDHNFEVGATNIFTYPLSNGMLSSKLINVYETAIEVLREDGIYCYYDINRIWSISTHQKL